MAGGHFKVESVKFFGGPGCTFILNGMVFTDPTACKIIYGAFAIESRGRIEPSSLTCSFGGAWRTSWPGCGSLSPPSSRIAKLLEIVR